MCILCTIVMMGEKHMMFRNLTLDGELKTAIKEVKKWGFMGMRIKNIAVLMGTLDNEDVMLTLMATPETKTLFSAVIIYEGLENWEKQLAKYQTVNASIAAKYGEPSKIIDQWEAPYSINNNPVQAFKENKVTYGAMYTTPEGVVMVNIAYVKEEVCTIVTYADKQNTILMEAEGGINTNMFDEDSEDAIIEE